MRQGTPDTSAQREKPASYLRMAELLLGSRITMALRVVVDRSIPDLLGNDETSVAELSSKTGIAAPALERLMRALTNVGVFREDRHGCFGNTDLSAWLRRGASPSLREISLVLNDDAPLRAWQQLDRVLETGQPVFAEVNGLTPFDYFAADPIRSENFAGLMRGVYGLEGPCIAAAFPFDRFSTLIDVGGGAGHILADILLAHPQLRGAVFDLPRTTDVARQFLSQCNVADRVEVLAGDFFEALPLGYDAYFIKSVLHDWNDDKCVEILRNCRAALPRNGCVLVTEIVLEPGRPIGHPHPLIDLEMMVSFGGKKRTARAFGELFGEAGLRLDRIHKIAGSFFSILEGSKA